MILSEQKAKSEENDRSMIENLHVMKELRDEVRVALETGDVDGFGEIMNRHWIHKKERSASMSNPLIDRYYDLALAHGAIGGKLVGAGRAASSSSTRVDTPSCEPRWPSRASPRYPSASTSKDRRFLFEIDYPFVVLAGGLGTRMKSTVPDVPKSLIPVRGRPFVEWQLEWLVEQGVRDVIFCIGHRGGDIRRHVGTGASLGFARPTLTKATHYAVPPAPCDWSWMRRRSRRRCTSCTAIRYWTFPSRT